MVDHTGGCSRRHLDFGVVGVSALEGECSNVTSSGCPCLVRHNEREDASV